MRTIDAIERVACVDRARVYAVGISNGGFMATVLACRAADRIAAVALFAPGINGVGECSPTRPLSVLEIHGTADTIVPYRNGTGRPDEDIPAFIAGGRHIELLPELRDAGVDPARAAWRFLSTQRLPAR
jgi:polyhydroxybutyrate depolymerase